MHHHRKELFTMHPGLQLLPNRPTSDLSQTRLIVSPDGCRFKKLMPIIQSLPDGLIITRLLNVQ